MNKPVFKTSSNALWVAGERGWGGGGGGKLKFLIDLHIRVKFRQIDKMGM